MRAPGTHLYGWIARWMEPSDAEQVAWPLLADVQAEWTDAVRAGKRRRAFAVRCAGYLQLLRVCLTVGAAQRWRAALQLEPKLILPWVLVGLAGVWLAVGGRLGGSRGPAQLVYVVLGVAVAYAAATTSWRQLRLLAPWAVVGSLLVLAPMPLHAVHDGYTGRWFRLGGMFVHAALLVMPLILLGLAWLADRRAWFGGYLAAVFGLLVLQPNLPVTGIVALGAVAVAWSSRSRGVALVISTGAMAAAMTRATDAYVGANLEILARQTAGRGALFVGVVFLTAGWLGWTLWTLARDAVTRPDRGELSARLGLGCALGLPAQVVVLMAADGAVPLLSYGGTATLALFATLGLALAARPRRSAPGAALS